MESLGSLANILLHQGAPAKTGQGSTFFGVNFLTCEKQIIIVSPHGIVVRV